MYIKIKITLQAAAVREIFLLFNGKTLLSDVPWIVRQECCMRVARSRFCNKIAGTVLQNIHRIELFCNMLQIFWIPGCNCNRLQLLSQNSFEDDDLPVQVKKKRMCSHGFRQELRTFQPNQPVKTCFWTLGN